MTTERSKSVFELICMYENMANINMGSNYSSSQAMPVNIQTPGTNIKPSINKPGLEPSQTLKERSDCLKAEESEFKTRNGNIDIKKLIDNFERSIEKYTNAAGHSNSGIKIIDQILDYKPSGLNENKVVGSSDNVDIVKNQFLIIREKENVIENILDDGSIINNKNETMDIEMKNNNGELCLLPHPNDKTSTSLGEEINEFSLGIGKTELEQLLPNEIIMEKDFENDQIVADEVRNDKLVGIGNSITNELQHDFKPINIQIIPEYAILYKSQHIQIDESINNSKNKQYAQPITSIDDKVFTRQQRAYHENPSLDIKIDFEITKNLIMPESDEIRTSVSIVDGKAESFVENIDVSINKGNNILEPKCETYKPPIKNQDDILITPDTPVNPLFVFDNLPDFSNVISEEQMLFNMRRLAEKQVSSRPIFIAHIFNSNQEVGASCSEDKGVCKNEIGKQEKMNKLVKIVTEDKKQLAKTDEIPLNKIKNPKVFINDETTPFKRVEFPKTNYFQAHAVAIETIGRCKKEKSIFQKIMKFFTCRSSRDTANENTEPVNSKIYDLIEHINQNCYDVPYLFLTPYDYSKSKNILKMIRNRDEIDFYQFALADSIAALGMYLREDLKCLFSVKDTKMIFKTLLTMGAEGEKVLKKHAKYLISKDRLLILHMILTLFVKISSKIDKIDIRYEGFVGVLIPNLFPTDAVENVIYLDLLKVAQIICEQSELDQLENVLKNNE